MWSVIHLWVSRRVRLRGCPSLGPTSSSFYRIPMISFTAGLSEELRTYMCTHAPLPPLTSSPEPWWGLSPHTEAAPIKFSTVLHVVTSLSLSYLTFPHQSTHKDHLPCLKYCSPLLATVNLTFSYAVSPHHLPNCLSDLKMPACSRTQARPSRPFCLSTTGSCPVVWRPYVCWWLCLFWFCPWTSYSST